MSPSEQYILKAANIEGVWQEDSGTIAINLYEVGEGDPPAASGASATTANPGGAALAEAMVNCATSAICPLPGEIVQYAHGSQSATNKIVINGMVGIGADAVAEGDSATAVGAIELGIWQVAAADEAARNELEVGGLLEIAAHAEAMAATGPAVAFAAIRAGISQVATSIGIDGIAAGSVDNSGELTVAANADAKAILGNAAATAVGAGPGP